MGSLHCLLVGLGLAQPVCLVGAPGRRVHLAKEQGRTQEKYNLTFGLRKGQEEREKNASTHDVCLGMCNVFNVCVLSGYLSVL